MDGGQRASRLADPMMKMKALDTKGRRVKGVVDEPDSCLGGVADSGDSTTGRRVRDQSSLDSGERDAYRARLFVSP
jgi:hypothetical protein